MAKTIKNENPYSDEAKRFDGLGFNLGLFFSLLTVIVFVVLALFMAIDNERIEALESQNVELNLRIDALERQIESSETK